MSESPINTKRLDGIHRGSPRIDRREETSLTPWGPCSSLPEERVPEVNRAGSASRSTTASMTTAEPDTAAHIG